MATLNPPNDDKINEALDETFPGSDPPANTVETGILVAVEAESNHPLVQKARISRVPIAELIGFRVEEIGGGRAVGVMQAGPQHANPMGTLHGGVLCDLSDAAMGMAFVSTLGPDETFTTVDLSINFFRPVWQTLLRAEARVVNRGKNLGYVECDVTDQDGRRVAKAQSTCIVLRGEQARQR
jgi:uncharacterized protein (TIGR00369 family)